MWFGVLCGTAGRRAVCLLLGRSKSVKVSTSGSSMLDDDEGDAALCAVYVLQSELTVSHSKTSQTPVSG